VTCCPLNVDLGITNAHDGDKRINVESRAMIKFIFCCFELPALTVYCGDICKLVGRVSSIKAINHK
jgi:hypothetical protein